MKTPLFKTLITSAMLVFAFFLLPSNAAAQVSNPYPVTNNLVAGCPIKFKYFIINPSCNTICYTSPIVSLNSGSSMNLNFGGCPVNGNCDVKIQIVQIGLMAISPPLTNSALTGTPASTGGGSCGTTVTLTMGLGSATVN